MTTNGQTAQGPCERRQRINQFGDYEDLTNMTAQDWDVRWAKQQTAFHVPKVHPMLQKHISRLTAGQAKCRVYVPLCGKSLDIKWLAELGHEVVGNEYVDDACRQFFEEQGLSYTTEKLTAIDGALYKANDLPIQIYRCDCFDLTSSLMGQFDCIWDRGGFVALAVKDRKRYANSIQKLMSKKCRYLLDCFLVDNNVFGGPPFHCDEQDVKKYFGSACKVQKIDEKDAFTKWQESWGIDSFVEEVYLLQPLST